MDDDAEHQRREHRRRVLKRATILLGIDKSEIPCSVRNQHAGGAELVIPVDSIVPERFTVYVPIDDVAYEAVMRWRRGDRIGVQFVGQGPKPKFHYG